MIPKIKDYQYSIIILNRWMDECEIEIRMGMGYK